jgi:NADH-quinone oxidoreductase subunit L
MMPLQAETLLALIVLLPLVGAVVNGLVGARIPKQAVTVIGTATVGLAFLATVAVFLALRDQLASGVSDPVVRNALWTWISSGTIHVQFGLAMDSLSAVMALIVTGVGFLIHVFSIGYMHSDGSYWWYFAYLNLFMFSMLSLVLGSNMLVMFLGWEGVGLCSYLLIGFWFDDDAKAKAGQKAFVVNRIGDFGFLIGIFVLLFYASGNLDFAHLRSIFSDEAAATGASVLRDPLTITIITLCLFVGATGKSAQIPLYVWLPDAMAGPTPVSALIHAATMVTAGVYMIARLNFLFVLSPVTMAVIATVGAATALFAATIGVVQRDIKKVLAYSTVSQLGFMFLGVGTGAIAAGVFHLMTHAFFKALLFLGSGAVIHAMHHEQDIFKMGGLRKILPVTHWTFLVGTAAIAGVPLLSGFFSKEAILHGAVGFYGPTEASLLAPWGLDPAAYAHLHGYFQILGVVGLVAAGFTAFYMTRLYLLTFWGEYKGDPHAWDHPHTPGLSMRVPLIALAVLAVFGGYIPLESWLEPITTRPDAWFHAPAGEHGGLSAVLLPLSIAVATLGIGLAAFLYLDGSPGRGIPERAQASARWLHTLVYQKYYVDELYDLVIVRPLRAVSGLLFRGVDRIAIDGIGVHGVPWILMTTSRLVRFGQNGDVQRYAAVMVLGLALILYLAQ